MRITVENYEAYLVDALEGRLNPAQEAALELFFQVHPELDERDALKEAMPMLELPENTAFNKEVLYKGVTPVGFVNADNYEDAFVSSMEGLLNRDEEVQLEGFIKANLHLEQDAKLFALTKLTPGAVNFPNKEGLRKSAPVIPLFGAQRVLRYAAAVAVLIVGLYGWWFNYNSHSPVYTPRMAEVALRKQAQSDDVFRVSTANTRNQQAQGDASRKAFPLLNQPLNEEWIAEAPVSIQPRSASALPVESRQELQLAAIPEFHFEAPRNESRAFFAGLVNEIKERLPQRQTDADADEPLFAKATEPVRDAVNQTIRYENLESDSLNRKGWMLALGPFTLSRVRYE